MAYIYAVYDDENFLAVGKEKEVAKSLGVTRDAVRALERRSRLQNYPKKRKIAIKWKEGEEDDDDFLI